MAVKCPLHVVQLVRELLAQGETYSRIVSLARISRPTVRRIKIGPMPCELRANDPSEELLPSPVEIAARERGIAISRGQAQDSSFYERCPSCGGRVIMPCYSCLLAAQKFKGN